MIPDRDADFWDRVEEARRIIDTATRHGGYATLSNCTDDLPDFRVHWKTAEALAERLPRVYRITSSPLGDYRRIHNIRLDKRQEPQS